MSFAMLLNVKMFVWFLSPFDKVETIQFLWPTTNIFTAENAFENVTCKTVAMLILVNIGLMTSFGDFLVSMVEVISCNLFSTIADLLSIWL